MLFWHKHDLEKAVIDLANFTPFPDEWTLEDKILFEQAFQFHGKCFHRIKQMVSSWLWLKIEACEGYKRHNGSYWQCWAGSPSQGSG